MRPDFHRMRAEGIVGAIHESTYPPSVRDAYYARRRRRQRPAPACSGAPIISRMRAIRSGRPIIFSPPSAAPGPARIAGGRPNEVLLVLDFEKNGHYPGGTMRVDQAVAFVGTSPATHRPIPRPLLERKPHPVRSQPGDTGPEARVGELLALGCELSLNSRASFRRGTSGTCGNTPATAFATCGRVVTTRSASRTSGTRSAISSAGAPKGCALSGKRTAGIRAAAWPVNSDHAPTRC